MRRMMLSCEEATYLSTKKDIEGVSMRNSMILRMHRAACKNCKNYYLQNKMITRNIRYFASKGLNGSPLHRLSTRDKSKLQRLISNKIQSN